VIWKRRQRLWLQTNPLCSPENDAHAWRNSILGVQSRFLGAVSVFDDVQALLPVNPEKARTTTDMLVAQQVVKLAQARDLSLHLLADTGAPPLAFMVSTSPY
jgi:GH35 family endo-1,4-beta-xylanase